MGNNCFRRRKFEPDPDYIDTSSDSASDYEISYQRYSDGKLSETVSEKVRQLEKKAIAATNLEHKRIYLAKEHFLKVENNLKSVRKILEELTVKNESIQTEARKKFSEPQSKHSLHTRSSILKCKYGHRTPPFHKENVARSKQSTSVLKSSISAVIQHLKEVARNRAQRCSEKSRHSLVTLQSHVLRSEARFGAGHSSGPRRQGLTLNSKSFLDAGVSMTSNGSRATTCIETLTRRLSYRSYSDENILNLRKRSLPGNQNRKGSQSFSFERQAGIGKSSNSLIHIYRNEHPSEISSDVSGEQVFDSNRDRIRSTKDSLKPRNMIQVLENNINSNDNSYQRSEQKRLVSFKEQGTQTSQAILEEDEILGPRLPNTSRITRSRYGLLTMHDIYRSRDVDERHRGRNSTQLGQLERLTESDSQQNESAQPIQKSKFF